LEENCALRRAESSGEPGAPPGGTARLITRSRLLVDNIVTGTYELRTVQPRIEPNGVKDYDARKFQIVLEIENSAKYLFPPLKDVMPK
jgi:hypothetical protein